MERKRIDSLLPGVLRDGLGTGQPLDALLEVMAGLHRPCEEALDEAEVHFCPLRAPRAFLPTLARWVGMHEVLAPFAGHSDGQGGARDVSGSLEEFRELIAAAAALHAWRGTAHGMRRFLEIATGVRGFRIDESTPDDQGRPIPFHVRVRAPAQARRQRVLIERIVEMAKPAYVTCEIEFASD